MADSDDAYICVAEADGESPVELPLEEDKTLLLTTLDAQFPGAVGIKFTNPKTGAARGVRRDGEKFFPPAKEGWGDKTYLCVFPKVSVQAVTQAPPAEVAAPAAPAKVDPEKPKVANDKQAKSTPPSSGQAKKLKRKGENGNASPPRAKTPKVNQPQTCDLIMLHLSYKSTEADVRKYLENKFGPVSKLQIKTLKSGSSKGFGFVRFLNYDDQRQVLRSKHPINGSNVTFEIHDRDLVSKPTKVFIQDLSSETTAHDIEEYFNKIGDVVDCFIIGKKRIAFVEFHDPNAALFALGTHKIKGKQVRVKIAKPEPGQPPKVYQKHEQSNSFSNVWENTSGNWNEPEFQNDQRRDGNRRNDSFVQGPQDRWRENFNQRGNDYVDDRDVRGRNLNANYGGPPTRNIELDEINILAAIKSGIEANTRKIAGNFDDRRGFQDTRPDWRGGNRFQSIGERNASDRFPSGGRGRPSTPPNDWNRGEMNDVRGFSGHPGQMRGHRNRFN